MISQFIYKFISQEIINFNPMYFLGISVVTAALILRNPLNNITKSIRDFYYHWARNFDDNFFKKVCLNKNLPYK